MEADDASVKIERAMVALRRHQLRRALATSLSQAVGEPFTAGQAMVVDVLDSGRASIGELAARLGVDASRASRMAAEAVEGDYARRVASQADGRRSELELTRRGRRFAAAARAVRRRLFDQVTADWTPQDREDFARLIGRFVVDLEAVTGG